MVAGSVWLVVGACTAPEESPPGTTFSAESTVPTTVSSVYPTTQASPPAATTVTPTARRPAAEPTIRRPGSRRPLCDPSYPGVCIPSPPPDLDCDEVGYVDFRVLPPDPHRFDADHDGRGCES